jgi:hypothetical protein
VTTPRSPWFRRRSAAEVVAFAEAWATLAAASLRLKALPFERVMRARPPRSRGALSEGEIARLAWAVDAARRRSWLRAVCIESALALRSMLRRRGVAATLHYGIRNDECEGLQAHVWLSLAGRTVIGGETADQFTEVATFDGPD